MKTEAKRRKDSKRQYDAYLRSAHWKEVRRMIMQRANGKCEDCGKREPEHVHHITYSRLGKERPEDLIALCLICHQARHPKADFQLSEEEIRWANKRRQRRESLKRKRKEKARKKHENEARKRLAEVAAPGITFKALAEEARARLKAERSVTVSSARSQRTDANNSTGDR